MGLRIHSFESILPPYVASQAETLDWLKEAHWQSELRSKHGDAGFDPEKFSSDLQQLLDHFSCKPKRLAQRRSAFRDFTHRRWEEMEIYPLHREPHGVGPRARSRAYARAIEPIFEQFFKKDSQPPEDLIHVTCTGYLSPSAAQALVEKRGWQQLTTVTHAYHMGCYAAFPALRIASGFLSVPPAVSGKAAPKRRIDVVHTELCSLHLDPSLHTPEQIVVQSLFADGYIRYSMTPGDAAAEPAMEILALREEMCPDSLADMTWICADWGMEMTLSREVPFKVATSIQGFLDRTFALAKLDFKKEKERAVFAIHPGGPRIVEGSREFLGLREDQVRFSSQVLLERGNMSSATLPHIWQGILRSPEVERGTLIASMAFGPGLTICGGLFRKV
jgi:predicted naringenin-chalcone synthase